MHTDEDSQTTLSKWPFILGDILLVATALAIAILGDWQLTNWQVASCVISVALGCSLFVLPYIVEHQVRVREDREDRGAELRILHKHVVNGREEVEAVSERIEAIEIALNDIDQSPPDLSGPLEALEKKLKTEFDKKFEPVAGQHLQLSEQLAATAKQFDELSAKLNDKLDAEALKVIEAELAALKKELAELPAKLPKPPTAEKPVAPTKAASSESAESETAVQEKAEPVTTSKKPIERPTRSPRERRQPEARLLKRAIEQKQDKSSAAVSRIIESKQKNSAPKDEVNEPTPAVEKEPPAEPAKSVEPEAKQSPEESAKPKEALKEPEVVAPEPKAEVAKPEAKAEPIEPIEPVEPAEPEIAKAPAPEKKVDAKPETKKAEAEDEPQDDMFGESVPPQVKKRVRTKKSDTAVIASVFIGIGNKPFVRGSGAGLNWDTGIEMEFEEIGRWRWLAPADLEAPVEIQLYRNDEVPDSTGKYTLEPGQQLDLSPVF